MPQRVCLLEYACPGTILADAHLPLRMCCMLAVYPAPHVIHVVTIPAEILVESNQVGESVEVVILITGSHSGTARVQLTGQSMKLCRHTRRTVQPTGIYLIEQPPEQNAGVIVVL